MKPPNGKLSGNVSTKMSASGTFTKVELKKSEKNWDILLCRPFGLEM